MYDAIREGGTYRVEIWPDPGIDNTVDAEGWVVNLHIKRAPGRRAHAYEFVRPVTVLVLGSPTMVDLWADSRLTREDQVTVDLLGVARVTRRFPPLPPDLVGGIDTLAYDPVWVCVKALTAHAKVRLGHPSLDSATVLGQRRGVVFDKRTA
jgi:hypothetical protein